MTEDGISTAATGTMNLAVVVCSILRHIAGEVVVGDPGCARSFLGSKSYGHMGLLSFPKFVIFVLKCFRKALTF